MDEHRHLNRDSLFLMADVCVDGEDGDHRIKVRNLSAGGMMGEGRVRVSRGNVVKVNIRNIGWVEGTVAWVQDDRFGIAFVEEIDPIVARAPVATNAHHEDYTRKHRMLGLPKGSGGALRKI
ncbi:MAG: PilZ domain-containing protein [Novosphingobium sp.]|nr:PilZ domain-containing protein [Novosphingobium sp.]